MSKFDITDILAERGQNVTLIRGDSTTIAAQRVIVAPSQSMATNREVSGAAGLAGRMNVTLIGYRDYPGQTDFNVRRGDLFAIGSTQYRVTYIDDTIPGRREAFAESTQT